MSPPTDFRIERVSRPFHEISPADESRQDGDDGLDSNSDNQRDFSERRREARAFAHLIDEEKHRREH